MNRAKFSCFLVGWTLFLLLFVLITVLAQSASSERNKHLLKVKTDFHNATLTFEQALQHLHKQGKVNIIASGTPLLPKALIAEAHTVEESLEAIATAFDYHWTIDKHGIVLLTKAFRKNGDAPQLDEAWIRHFTNENVQILQTASPGNEWWTEEVVTLAKMLDPEQWFILQSGQKLEASSLTVAQLQQIQRAGVANNTFDAKRKWQQLSRFLVQFEEAKIQLVPITLDEAPSDGLLYQLRVFDASSQLSPLYELEALQAQLPKENNFVVFSPSRRLTDNDALQESRGREYPTGVSGRWSKSITLSKTGIMLKELMPLLDAPDELSYSADHFLLARHYSVYFQGVNKRALTDALAEIEDWHWQESKSGNVTFQPRSLKDIGDLLAVPRRLQAALPRDVRDYLGARRPSLTLQQMIPTLISDARMEKMRWFNQRKEGLGYSDLKTLMLKLASTKTAEEKISVIKLKKEERQLLLNALLRVAMLDTAYSLYGGDFPPYILAPNTAHLELSGNLLRIKVTRHADGIISSMSFGAPVGKAIPTQSSPPSAPDNPQK